MGKSSTFENDIQKLILQNIDIAGIGDAGGLLGSVVPGVLYLSLHTADPTAGDQTTSEATYTGYARLSAVRSASGWTIVADLASNAAIVTFGLATVGSETITHFGVGTDLSGAGKLLYSSLLDSSLLIVAGQTTPEFGIGDLTITED